MWGQLFPLFQFNQPIWAPHHRNTSFFLAFFVPNNGGVATSCNPQELRCIICHMKQTNVHASNGNKIPIKGLITYKENGISTLSKHVAYDHVEEDERWGACVLEHQEKNSELEDQ
jgi:hypothetical protein